MKFERLFLEDADDCLDLVQLGEAYRIEDNTVTSHEALPWNCPLHVHLSLVDPSTPNFPKTEILPTS